MAITPQLTDAAGTAATTVAGHRLDRSTIPLLVTLGLGVFAGALDLGVLSPALPALGTTFGVGPRDLAWVFTLYLLANVVAIPVMSKLADQYGRRPIYILCVSVFAAGSVLAIAAQSFPVFLLARAIQAIGAGGIFPVATAAIAEPKSCPAPNQAAKPATTPASAIQPQDRAPAAALMRQVEASSRPARYASSSASSASAA